MTMVLLRSLLLFISLVIQINTANSENILAFLPSVGRSHVKPIQPLLQQLAARGHNVTLFSYFPLNKKIANFTDIAITTKIEFGSIEYGNLRKYSGLFNWIYFHDELQKYHNKLLSERQLQNFLNSTDTKFDLIFIELYHGDGTFALSQRFNCPIIALSFQPILTIYNWLTRNPTTFSYIPHLYLPFTDVMTFWQRTVNTAFGIFTVLFYNFVSVSGYQKKVNSLLGQTEKPNPSIEELSQNVSLILVETHFSSIYVRPNLPNIIEVGGIHIDSLSPLPQDLQEFMDQSKHGVVYVSLGTLIDPTLAGQLGLHLMNIFKKLKQRVIWKWKKDFFQEIPSNVIIRDWLPQIDILNHPNCKLFISHGGYHSLLETIYSGVPIFGLPFMTDQHHTTAFIEKLKIGRKASPDSSEEELSAAVQELLTDEMYRRNARHQATIFRDRPMSPMDTAIYWTEYVLRHKGAPHLKSAAVDLYWFQHILLDVILFCSLVLIIFIYAFKKSAKKIVQIITKVFSKPQSIKQE